MATTHQGYLLIADITGYTRYLSESELEHAQETLTALLEFLVDNTEPPLIISRLAGDAVISYGLSKDFFKGQSFIEKIEQTYVLFRKTIERLVLNNSCQCNACANISNLDLKFFVHYGTFGIQRISDHDELVGSDIILIHRLLKNSVVESTGIQAYALYTDTAIRHLGVEAMKEMLRPHRETYEHLGEVDVWLEDMHKVWQEKRSQVAVDFPEDKIWAQFEVQIGMPPERVWDYLALSEFRNILTGSDKQEITEGANGKVGSGSIYQCYHGDKVIPHTILEWQPFETIIVKELSPIFQNTGGISRYRLEAKDESTALTKDISRPIGPFVGRVMMYMMKPLIGRFYPKVLDKFKREIEKDHQKQLLAGVNRVDISDHQIRDAAQNSLEESARGQVS